MQQIDPIITIVGGVSFVIAWEDRRNGNKDIYFQRYNSSGIAQSLNTKANDDAGGADQKNSSLSMDEGGNFIIVWTDNRFNENKPDIVGQRYFC
ncbi:MAG: hypothetical protein MZV64_41585 [Ignavibacteriales bacterium]|nr:hypothetical protein [Ignavibacteriales bacterium]